MSVQSIASAAFKHGRSARGLVDEVEQASPTALIVAGAAGPAAKVEHELLDGAAPGAVRRVVPGRLDANALSGGIVLVYAIAGSVCNEDVEALRTAERIRVPIVCLLIRPDAASEDREVPYVLARDIVRVPGTLPLGSLLERVAVRAGSNGFTLATNVPRLRPAVADAIVAHYARLNGAIGATPFAGGATLPVLTVNQLRMVARLAAVHGVAIDAKRAGEILAVVAAAVGFRSAARLVAGQLGPRWAIKGGFAYGGTVAIGEAAIARFAAIACPAGGEADEDGFGTHPADIDSPSS